MRNWTIIALIGIALLAQGCSNLEPRTGTRVTIAFPPGKQIDRAQLLSISKYLITKGQLVLGVKAPRVDTVSEHTLILLLPGKKVQREAVQRLIEPSSIELYHLTSVATDKSPNRPWKIKVPSTIKGPYLFLGPNAQRIDSHEDAKALLSEVVGSPKTKPVLTGADILPTAFLRQARKGWGVQVQFNRKGAEIFSNFTKHNRGEYLAVFYNGQLVSAPIVRDAIYGGEALITGFPSESKARGAVSEINAGALPAKIKIARVEYY